MNKLLKIEKDVFFIAERLKNIDESYEVYFNLGQNCYEVHSTEQAKNSYCFHIPYPQLDERTLDYAIKTRSENRDKIIKEIEQNNQLLYEKNIKEQVNKLREAICM